MNLVKKTGDGTNSGREVKRFEVRASSLKLKSEIYEGKLSVLEECLLEILERIIELNLEYALPQVKLMACRLHPELEQTDEETNQGDGDDGEDDDEDDEDNGDDDGTQYDSELLKELTDGGDS